MVALAVGFGAPTVCCQLAGRDREGEGALSAMSKFTTSPRVSWTHTLGTGESSSGQCLVVC